MLADFCASLIMVFSEIAVTRVDVVAGVSRAVSGSVWMWVCGCGCVCQQDKAKTTGCIVTKLGRWTVHDKSSIAFVGKLVLRGSWIILQDSLPLWDGINWHFAAYLSTLWMDVDRIFWRCGCDPRTSRLNFVGDACHEPGFRVHLWGQRSNVQVGMSWHSCVCRSPSSYYVLQLLVCSVKLFAVTQACVGLHETSCTFLSYALMIPVTNLHLYLANSSCLLSSLYKRIIFSETLN